MKTSLLLYGEPAEVANELCSCNEPEEVLHVDLIAALGNALNRIAKLEKELRDKSELLEHAQRIGGFQFLPSNARLDRQEEAK